MTDRQEWITTGEAARMLGVRSINTIKRLIRDGRVRAIRPGTHYRVARDDLLAILSAKDRSATSPDPRAEAHRRWVADWAKRHRVARVALFGSAARGEMRAGSDVDVAVEFDIAGRAGFFEMVTMRDELAERFGRSVDLGTIRSMRPDVRASAERDMVYLYET